jgi:hypothetical protein
MRSPNAQQWIGLALVVLLSALAGCSLDFKHFEFASASDGGADRMTSGIANQADAAANDASAPRDHTPGTALDAATRPARDAGMDAASPNPSPANDAAVSDPNADPDAMVSMPTSCMPDQMDVCASDADGNGIPGLTPERDGLGACALGQKLCNADGEWGPCEGAVGPSPRDCESPDDNDCDGAPDDCIDSTCQCNAAHPTIDCTGANNCPGVRNCGPDHQLGACEAPAACECQSGQRSCSGGPNDCPGGTQVCGADHTWSACIGAPDHCECSAGQSRACTAIAGAPPCGSASCSGGQWDTSSCAATSEWCQDLDGDGTCSSLCTLQCSGGPNLRTNCLKTDCDDNDLANNPSTPADCTSSSSCVKQVMEYSATKNACECKDTITAAHENQACANLMVCRSGVCTCNGGASCQLGCRTGEVSCILGPSCSSLQDSPAGTPCGSASFCNGANVCYTNCTLGSPSCVPRSGCVSGSTNISCAEGNMCKITYLPVGASCISPPNTHCEEDHTCTQ